MESTGQPKPSGDLARLEITPRVVLVAFAGGAAGLVAMAPVLVGLPALLGLFPSDPMLDVAALGRVVGLEASLPMGLAVFVAGGAVGLPLLFVVAGSFLPPRRPRAARGATFAVVIWTGFVLAFWPGISAAVAFMTVSLVGHLIYGLVLGAVMDRFAHIPRHAV